MTEQVQQCGGVISVHQRRSHALATSLQGALLSAHVALQSSAQAHPALYYTLPTRSNSNTRGRVPRLLLAAGLVASVSLGLWLWAAGDSDDVRPKKKAPVIDGRALAYAAGAGVLVRNALAAVCICDLSLSVSTATSCTCTPGAQRGSLIDDVQKISIVRTPGSDGARQVR
jgi:hypothetical protein